MAIDIPNVGSVLTGHASHAYLADETETRSLRGDCDAVILPSTVDEVAAAVRWAYAHDVPLTPRGGGTGYAGGAVPVSGGIVIGLERMKRIRAFDPLLWRIEVEAGVTTNWLHRLTRENGLYYPPDPGAAEQSQIGGNIATNAGGPHAFKYGTTGAWVTGLEVVVPPGEVIRLGGPLRKDVAAYDLKRVLIGSEGTLGIITAAWLRLIPPPEQALPVVAFYPDLNRGVEAVEAVLGNGITVAALEFLDAGALQAAPPAYSSNRDAAFAVLCEADGTAADVEATRRALLDVLASDALEVHAPTTAGLASEVWRWRESMTSAVTAYRGGKVSEDIVVPIDKLGHAISRCTEIGLAAGLATCCWGHAGDGNIHATFMIDRTNEAELAAAEAAAAALFAVAIELGGSISGEHGIGLAKVGHLESQLGSHGFQLHRGIKDLFDPKNLLNPGKKI